MRSSLAPSVVGRLGSSGVSMPNALAVVKTFWMPTSLKRWTEEILRDCCSDCRSVMVPCVHWAMGMLMMIVAVSMADLPQVPKHS